MHTSTFIYLAFCGLVAAKGSDKGNGRFTTTLNGKVYSDDKYRIRDLACTGTLTIRGINNGFDIDCQTMNLFNYAFTGADVAGRMVNKPTTVIASKTMALTSAQIGTPSISEIESRDGGIVITFASGGGKVKYQAKDNPQGGLLQVETEYSTNVTHTITLAQDMFYFLDPNLNNAVRIGNGVPADSTHTVLVAKDSPQGANRLYQDGRTSQWNVWSGGRMGAVFGEDALEDAPPTTVCTSDCQAQNQIRGSLPVTTLPDTIVPIGAGDD